MENPLKEMVIELTGEAVEEVLDSFENPPEPPPDPSRVVRFIAGFASPLEMTIRLNDVVFRPAMRHPTMTSEKWQQAYDNAWRAFYAKEHLVATLSRVNPGNYWGAMGNYWSYRWSVLREGVHPMLGGFYRYRRWQNRRPGLASESRLKFWLDEVRRHLRLIGSLIGEYYFFQDVYLRTKWMPTIREQTAKVCDLHQRLSLAREAMSDCLRSYSASVGRSSWFGRTFGQAAHRAWLDSFWKNYARLKWRLLLPSKFLWHGKMLGCTFTELCYWTRFNFAILTAILRQKV